MGRLCNRYLRRKRIVMDETYPLFENCYDMISKLCTEKEIHIEPIGQLAMASAVDAADEAVSALASAMYADMVAKINRISAESPEVKGPLDLIDWGSIAK